MQKYIKNGMHKVREDKQGNYNHGTHIFDSFFNLS